MDTRTVLLEAAEHLVRSRGYSAISYADLADAVGIRKASIHHHFPGKADLGAALIDAYVERFRVALGDIERLAASAPDRLARYAAIYEDSVRRGLLCLCGMMATETHVVPPGLRTRMRVFFADQLDWLEAVLAAGVAAGQVTLRGTPRAAAEHVLSTLQGASLVAWGADDPAIVARAGADLLAAFRP